MLRLTPRGGSDRVDGVGPGGVLLARVAAAPVDGAANAALRRLLAKAIGVPLGAITLVAGAGGRRKRIEVTGRNAVELRRLWPGLAAVDAAGPPAG